MNGWTRGRGTQFDDPDISSGKMSENVLICIPISDITGIQLLSQYILHFSFPFLMPLGSRPLFMERLPSSCSSRSARCVCGKWLWNLWASRTRSRREHVFMHVSCITDLAFTSEHLSPPPSCGQGPSRSPRPSPLSGPRRPPSRENVIMVVRKDQICRPRPPVSQSDVVAFAS